MTDQVTDEISPPIAGMLLINKPAGWTSFDVVAKIRGMLRKATGQKIKVGHAGTLDPFATGLLVLAVGKATKQIDTFMKLDKTYEAEFRLGATSSTDDCDGEITRTATAFTVPNEAQIQQVLAEHTGAISQIPPQFSAIKVNGKRSYALAREGKTAELKPRAVTVYNFTDVKYAYPELRCAISVSSGTYIRSLARDIGEQLGCGAYVQELRRTKIGDMTITHALDVNDLNSENILKNIDKNAII